MIIYLCLEISRLALTVKKTPMVGMKILGVYWDGVVGYLFIYFISCSLHLQFDQHVQRASRSQRHHD